MEHYNDSPLTIPEYKKGILVNYIIVNNGGEEIHGHGKITDVYDSLNGFIYTINGRKIKQEEICNN